MMTRDEILAMPAGREMDALIAEKVMGGDFAPATKYYFRPPFGRKGLEFVNHYSTDIKAAWEVVKKGARTMLEQQEEGWYCEYAAPATYTFHSVAETAPLAICRAALLAVFK